jgi:selenocysteine-specific elongation factor
VTAAHRVLGVAGHIDHGKTALVKALTGTETDRLPEEKKRGITIELGFARWALADDLEVSVIDMPGHEKFVKNMVAGAAGIDAVMLVVAADDGVMPQTQEHLAVCELLGVERGFVALSKMDLVEEELVELVQEDVALAVQGTFLEGAPIVPVSALAGSGLDALADAARAVLGESEERSLEGPAVLPVDRVFTKAGFGTIVTGTLLTGTLAVGDDLVVVPGPKGEGREVKVRGLQVHGEAAERAACGRRVAVNVRGEDAQEIARGELLATPGRVAQTRALHVEARMLPEAPAIEERDEVAVHVGTAEVLAKAVPLRDGPLGPGERGAVRLSLDHEVAVFAGQRVVLRKPGAHGQATLGGGRVLDPLPRSGKGSFKRWVAAAARLLGDDPLDGALAVVEDARESGVARAELVTRLPLGADVDGALAALAERGDVVLLEDGRVIAAATLARIESALEETARRYHAEHPLLFAVAAKELETQLPEVARSIASAAVDRLVVAGKLERAAGGVRAAGHDPTAGEAGAKLREVEKVYRAGALTPPTDDDAQKAAKLAAKDFKEAAFALGRAGRLRRLGELYFHDDALAALKDKVRGFFEGSAELTTADFKELAGGVSRKYAIPLLEHLDKGGVTQRKGDVRVRGRG